MSSLVAAFRRGRSSAARRVPAICGTSTRAGSGVARLDRRGSAAAHDLHHANGARPAAPRTAWWSTPSDDVSRCSRWHACSTTPSTTRNRPTSAPSRRLRGSLSRGGRTLICVDDDTRRGRRRGPVGSPARRRDRDRRSRCAPCRIAGAGSPRPWWRCSPARRSTPGWRRSSSKQLQERDGAYRNAGFQRTSTSVHMSLASDADA